MRLDSACRVARVHCVAGNRHGFILIAVLWLLVALSGIGIHAAVTLRTERLAAANLLDEARGREAALAGAEYARSRLSAAVLQQVEQLRAQTPSSNGRERARPVSVQNLFRVFGDDFDDRWRNPQELVLPEMAFGTAQFRLQLRDTRAALNLNQADEAMLRGFFAQGLRLDYALADRLTQSILDWRDLDEIPRLGGAEREQYMRAGAPILPANREFGEIDDLRHVQGMTPDIFAAAAPHLILVSSGRINVNSAPEPVLLAIPGMTPAAATEILRMREAGEFVDDIDSLLGSLSDASARALRAADDAFQDRVAFQTTEVEIISDGRAQGSPVESRVRLVVSRSDFGAAVVTREFN
jgi:type II secretory pathway component PulK